MLGKMVSAVLPIQNFPVYTEISQFYMLYYSFQCCPKLGLQIHYYLSNVLICSLHNTEY